MRILFTAPRFHTNQVPIVKGLKNEGHEVYYFVSFIGATEDHTYCLPRVIKPSRNSLDILKKNNADGSQGVESVLGGRYTPNYKELKKAFDEVRPDIVICRDRNNFTLCVNHICVEKNIPCILYNQEPLYPMKQPSRIVNKSKRIHSGSESNIPKRALNKIHRILNPEMRMLNRFRNVTGYPTIRMTPVEYTRLPKSLSEGEPDPNAVFIPFVAPEVQGFGRRDCCSDGTVRILSVGKFRDYKNLPILVDAAKLLPKDFKWRMTIVGQAVSEEELVYKSMMEDKIHNSGLENQIQLQVNIPYNAMPSIYAAHDLFILSSKKELASISVIEAMAYGLAVISTDCNGTASYIEEGVTGYTFETCKAESLADAISKCCELGVNKFGKNAIECAKAQYNFDSYYEGITKLFRKIGIKGIEI